MFGRQPASAVRTVSGSSRSALVRLVPRPWVPRVEHALDPLRPHTGSGGGGGMNRISVAWALTLSYGALGVAACVVKFLG
ncbi:hypothetical protein HOU95_gp035 [Streptomyces phage Hiyaa]|uniref:Uncharacterized protein n=1 Tax=Streptomyces phage Hiyaa TaxID=2499072 RepID=A0A3S9U8N9_9CAUD|nr:hypothetical protein HOU95_gp035 [Streptomyces phage Hiyaa]AZS06675.1 hypothetical protein SEA_HIYAA_35 [Streptomyces phage Hiyaa]